MPYVTPVPVIFWLRGYLSRRLVITSGTAIRAPLVYMRRLTWQASGKFRVLRGFYRYLLSREYVTSSPLPTQVPKEPEPLIPHIFTREEIRQLLQAAEQRQWHGRKLDAQTLRTLLLLLYGAGLRISEE